MPSVHFDLARDYFICCQLVMHQTVFSERLRIESQFWDHDVRKITNNGTADDSTRTRPSIQKVIRSSITKWPWLARIFLPLLNAQTLNKANNCRGRSSRAVHHVSFW
ncbi:hypothetical protein PVAP13_9NG241500 [Panicum virgatum]|uniref:Uncharacterized protein n=1 Tax=Panicum virgatum TaxID=38727 RepID=A0A8T0MIR8_PANVG|nr:hypothetical protein PVAP13_9NG241500 [Panicum virgatum]